MNVEDLAAEVMSLILERVDPLSWPCCRLVCRRWNQLLLGHASARWNSRRHRVLLGAPPDYAARLAYAGRLEVLRWAVAQGCPLASPRICAEAARGGRLEVLLWLREQGCPWDASTCSSAAWAGRLDILQWARSKGCPWDSRTTSNAATKQHEEVLRWAVAHGCSTRLHY